METSAHRPATTRDGGKERIKMQTLIDKIESMGFECEGGPLSNCADWQELKELAIASYVLAKHRHVKSAPKRRVPVLYSQRTKPRRRDRWSCQITWQRHASRL